MRGLFILLISLLLSVSAHAADPGSSLVEFLKTCGKDCILDEEAADAGPNVGHARSAITQKIFDIDEKNARVNKLLEPGFHYHVRALEAPEKRFETALGWRKGDSAFSVSIDYREGGTAALQLLINARSGRLVYYFDKEPKIYVGTGKDDVLTADEKAMIQAGYEFYSQCVQFYETAPEKYRPLLHPSVRKSFKANLKPASRVLPPQHGDGTYDTQGVQLSIDGAVGKMVAMDGFLMLRLKREGNSWLVLELKENLK